MTPCGAPPLRPHASKLPPLAPAPQWGRFFQAQILNQDPSASHRHAAAPEPHCGAARVQQAHGPGAAAEGGGVRVAGGDRRGEVAPAATGAMCCGWGVTGLGKGCKQGVLHSAPAVS
jgi:hypothetical protein